MMRRDKSMSYSAMTSKMNRHSPTLRMWPTLLLHWTLSHLRVLVHFGASNSSKCHFIRQFIDFLSDSDSIQSLLSSTLRKWSTKFMANTKRQNNWYGDHWMDETIIDWLWSSFIYYGFRDWMSLHRNLYEIEFIDRKQHNRTKVSLYMKSLYSVFYEK